MRILRLLVVLLPILCHAELQLQEQREGTDEIVDEVELYQEQRKLSDEVVDDEEEVIKNQVRKFYRGRIGKDGRPKQLNMEKVKEMARKRAFRETLAAGSNETIDDRTQVPPVLIEPDTPQASLWYPPPSSKKDWHEYFEKQSDKDGVKNDLPSPETQCVYLDFNEYASYSVDIVNYLGEKIGEFGPFHGYPYKPHERKEIMDRIKKDYHLYNVYFVTEKPDDDHEPYTTIRFNANDFPDNENAIVTVVRPPPAPPGLTRVFSVLFGQAEGIDYLNLIRDDLVRVQANLWSFLVEIDPSGNLFTLYTGIPVANRAQLMAALSRVTINQSANTASHELGHALGLRHHEAFGAPGDGIPITDRPASTAYYGPYPGPALANETTLHLMASSAVVGLQALNFPTHANQDRFFSERSSVKLTLAEGCGNFLTEKEAKHYGTQLEGMEIPEFYVQNPIEEGENKGGRYLRIDTVNIAGSIKYYDEVDRYRLYLNKDRIFTAEVISFDSTLKYRVMTTLTLYRVVNDGRRILVAANDFPFESFDPQILDFTIPETGTYILAVEVQQTIPIDRNGDDDIDDLYSVKKLGGEEFLTGEYNLLIYNHHPEIQKHKYRDDQKYCFPTKKKEYDHKHSDDYEHGSYGSDSSSYSEHYDGGESYSDDEHYYSSSSGDDYEHGEYESHSEDYESYSEDYEHESYSTDDYTHDESYSTDDYTHDESYSTDDYTHDESYSSQEGYKDEGTTEAYSDQSLRGSSAGNNGAQKWGAH